jgi:hypothetical protein
VLPEMRNNLRARVLPQLEVDFTPFQPYLTKIMSILQV